MNVIAAAIVIGLVSQVQITPGWLARQGPGPYFLDQPGATYILEADVTTPGTAFLVLAPNVTLDLNGHTVTYDNAQPITVPNGGFEEGDGPTDVPGWDVSRAPGAVRSRARTGAWGDWMLTLPGLGATATLASGAIAIPRAGIQYAAIITPKSSTMPTVTLSVVDTVTGAVLASAKSNNPDRGFSPVVKFTPTTTHPVQLVVTIAPTPGRAGTVDLDYAAVYRTGNYGVVATPSPWNLPPHLQASFSATRASKPAHFTIRGGSIVQGHAGSYSASSVFAMSIDGITVDRVFATASGADTNILEMTYATDPVVTGCRLIGRLDRISDRMRIFAAVRLGDVSGPVRVEGNAIEGRMHTGITLTRKGTVTSPIRIRDNTIEHDALATDGYGVVLCNVRRFDLIGNKIRPINGRGLMLDTFSRGVTEGGRVIDNVVEARERPNLEYEATSLEAVAMTVRVFSTGTVKDVSFVGNTFSARTGPGDDWAAAGARISISRDNPSMVGSGLVFQRNRFRALVDGVDPPAASGPRSSTAWGLTLAAVPAGTGLKFLDNEFASNDVSLNFGDDTGYGETVTDVLFAGNTIRRLGEGAALPHRGVAVGDWRNTTTGVRLIGMRYADGADPKITFLGDKPKEVEVGRLVSLSVTNPDGTAAPKAAVRIVNDQGQTVWEGTADDRGLLMQIPVVTTVYRQEGVKPDEVSVIPRDRSTVVVSHGGREKTLTVAAPTKDQELRVQLP